MTRSPDAYWPAAPNERLHRTAPRTDAPALGGHPDPSDGPTAAGEPHVVGQTAPYLRDRLACIGPSL